jgi:hypothetical protein
MPAVSMDTFFNKHIIDAVKTLVVSTVEAEGEQGWKKDKFEH